MLDLYLKDIPLLDAKSKTIRGDVNNLVTTLKKVLEDRHYDETIVRREKSITSQSYILTRQNMDNRLEFILTFDKGGDFHALMINKYFNQTSAEEEQTPTRIVHIDYKIIHGEGELTLNDIKEINSFLKQFFIDCFVQDLDKYIQQEYAELLKDKSLSFNRSAVKDRLVVFTTSLLPNTVFATLLEKEGGLIVSSLNVGFGIFENTRDFYCKGVAVDYRSVAPHGHIAGLSDTPNLMSDADIPEQLEKTYISPKLGKDALLFYSEGSTMPYMFLPTMSEDANYPIRYSSDNLYYTRWTLPVIHEKVKHVNFRVKRVFFGEGNNNNFLEVIWTAVGKDESKPFTVQFNETVYFKGMSVEQAIKDHVKNNGVNYVDKLLKVFE